MERKEWVRKLESVKALVSTIEEPSLMCGGSYYESYPSRSAVKDRIRVARVLLSELSKELDEVNLRKSAMQEKE